MNQRTKELDRRIVELNTRDEEIERALYDLAPARAKGDGPIQFEDYTGVVGEQKHRKWDALMAERARIRSELRERENEMYDLAHARQKE
jgi:hypothetical protein